MEVALLPEICTPYDLSLKVIWGEDLTESLYDVYKPPSESLREEVSWLMKYTGIDAVIVGNNLGAGFSWVRMVSKERSHVIVVSGGPLGHEKEFYDDLGVKRYAQRNASLGETNLFFHLKQLAPTR